MRKLLATGSIAALALAILAVTATAAGKPIAFVGKYTGTAVTKQSDTTLAITASGTGSGTLIGAGKVAGVGTGDTSQQPCIPFTGTGSLTGKTGTIAFKVNPGATSCGDEGGHTFAFTGKAAVLKATGKLAKAKGTLKLTGTYDHDSGAFTVKFSGSLVK
ncbi:MAG TPA: hypothetical protein VGQ38_14335 [Gaiellaceae bacterium]|jgi:hypothetical protein|nr:hypothetical protein [Gaiellaceae bacterium]